MDPLNDIIIRSAEMWKDQTYWNFKAQLMLTGTFPNGNVAQLVEAHFCSSGKLYIKPLGQPHDITVLKIIVDKVHDNKEALLDRLKSHFASALGDKGQ